MRAGIFLSIIIVLIALTGVGVWLKAPQTTPTEPITEEPVFCTADAKICPDGTGVGRIPPKCDFAPCPTATNSTATSSSTTNNKLEAGIGYTASSNNVKIYPLEVLEDSRCPEDVQCIQAGTVRLKAKVESGLGTSTVTLTLGEPITTEAEEITLIKVAPTSNSKKVIKPEEYLFTFSIKNK